MRLQAPESLLPKQAIQVQDSPYSEVECRVQEFLGRGENTSRLGSLRTEETVTTNQARVCDKLKHLGYGRKSRIRMYGEEFDLTSDPRFVQDHLVVVDAVKTSSGNSQLVGIPLMVVQMVEQELRAA